MGINKWEEKRRFPRIKLKTPIRYQIRGESEFDYVLSDNIGVGGMSFVTNKFIASATPLMLEINVLSRILRPIGKIAWSTYLAHLHKNQLGIEFVELDPNEKNYLQDFVSMQREQSMESQG